MLVVTRLLTTFRLDLLQLYGVASGQWQMPRS
jgi:hypothetical protein